MNQLWQDFVTSAPIFLRALVVTLELSAASLAIGTVIGLVFALLKLSKRRPLQWLANGYITLIRGTPLIVQIFWIYYGLVKIVSFDAFWAASFALAAHAGAYIAEIFRAGIVSIDRGQMEAARSLGMTYAQAMRRIILPQAFRRIVPPLGNQFIIGIKDSSLAAFISMEELFNWTMRRASSTFRDMNYYTIAAIYYLAVVILFTMVVHWLERRLNVDSTEVVS